MRLAIGVLASGVAQSVIFLRLSDWVGVTAFIALAYIVLAAMGAGWFAMRRTAVAGALSVAVAVVIYACVTFFGPAGVGMPPTSLVLGTLQLLTAFLPYIAIGAAAGAGGGWLRRRILPAAR